MSKKKRARNLIIVFLVLVILAGGYYVSTILSNKNSGTAQPDYVYVDIIGNLDYSKIVMIEGQGIILERKETSPGVDEWVLVSLNGETPKNEIILDQFLMEYLAWSLSTIVTDSVVEDEPDDYSIYGFENPVSRITVTDSDGSKDRFLLGDLTPSRTSYYLMQEGNPKVYTISIYSAEIFTFTLNQLRLRIDLPYFDFMSVTQLRLELPHTVIDIGLMPDSVPYRLSSSISWHIMNSPYTLSRGADLQAFSDLIDQINLLYTVDFIDDVSSLETYGLDKPSRIYVQSMFDTLDLLVGEKTENYYYAMLAGSSQIFTVSGLDAVLNTKPFTMAEKFALLLSIYSVEHLSVSGGGQYLGADIQISGDTEIFYLNGRKAEERSFKTWYQAVIGLLVDAEIPDLTTGMSFPAQFYGSEGVTIEYWLNTSPNAAASITLIPYDRDFYALIQEGVMEFLVSRNQVNRIWETADRVIFE